MANQAWQITRPGVLELKDLGSSIPEPGPKQALVRVFANSLNYRDKLVVEHSPDYPQLAQPDLTPCSDGAGIVEKAGADSSWKKGDRVYIHPNVWLSGEDGRAWKFESTMGAGEEEGSLRRWIIWDDERLVRIPDYLSLEEASTSLTAGVTAYRALFHGPRKLEPGMTVLTQGTGGVSCYGIQLAAAAGLTVVATSSSDEKLEVAKQLGAKYLINYRKTPDWSAEVLKATGGIGVDMVLDVVGAGSIEQTIKATRFGGAIVNVGLLDQPNLKVDIMTSILYGGKTLVGNLGAGSRDMLINMFALMDKHKVHPKIAKVFEFEDAPKALDYLTKLSEPGKVVVKV